ncbi:MAG: hypothetical protein NVS2B14_11900 [Chamaesiphon sp.]
MSNRRQPNPHKDVTVEHNGKTYTGFYQISKGMITVSHVSYGSKATQLGGLSEDTLSKFLLLEMVRQHNP